MVKRKNQWLINQYKELEKAKKELKKRTGEVVPEIYACFAKVLYEEEHMSEEKIAELFTRTQELWDEMVENDSAKDMIDWCEKTTGILLAAKDEEGV